MTTTLMNFLLSLTISYTLTTVFTITQAAAEEKTNRIVFEGAEGDSLLDGPNADLGLAWLFSQTIDGSIVAKESLAQTYRVVLAELNSHATNEESAGRINVELARLQLPQIQFKNMKIQFSQMSGFDSSDTVGVEITDGVNRFCLPCTLGHNSFAFGITPL